MFEIIFILICVPLLIVLTLVFVQLYKIEKEKQETILSILKKINKALEIKE